MRSLTFHGGYRCRHSGVCCTSGWPIPIEADRLAAAEQAVAAGTIELRSPTPAPFEQHRDAPLDSPAVVAIRDGACVFHRSATGGCGLQAALGHAALPLACRQFPRVSIGAPGATSVTLSHYCPTAAGLLDEPGPIAIVTTSAAFPETGEYVGLDVTDALPPLLRPDMLMDWESWWRWEEAAVDLLAEAPHTDEALVRLEHAVEHARTWSPADGSLSAWVSQAAGCARTSGCGVLSARPRAAAGTAVLGQVLDAIPASRRPGVDTLAGRAPSDAARRRFLTAHAFGSWTAHLGQGLRTWFRSVQVADGLLSAGLGVREADLLLRHLSDPSDLARQWSTAEDA